MSEWSNDFHANIAEVDTRPECIYNEEQTSLYHQQLPNSVYVDESNKKDYSGANQKKDKTRCTLMVVTSAIEKSITCRILQTDGQRKANPYIKTQANYWYIITL